MIPWLKSVNDAAERLADRITANVGGAPVRALVTGVPGSGKSTVLDRLGALLEGAGRAPIRAIGPDPDLDTPVHLALQLTGDLRKHEVNGVLDPVATRTASWVQRCSALQQGLQSLPTAVVLVDLPPSWSRSASAIADPFESRGLWFEFMEQLLRLDVPVVIAAERRNVLDAFESARTFDKTWLEPESESGLLSSDDGSWGDLAENAGRTGHLLGERSEALSPLALRVAVALNALGSDDQSIVRAADKGIHGLVNELRKRACGNPFERAWALAALPRFTIDPTLLQTLVTKAVNVGDVAFRVLRDALLLPQPDEGGVALHPLLRSRAPFEALGDALRPAHARLAAAHQQSMNGLQSRDDALHRLEAAHHGAKAGDVDLVRSVAIDAWQLCVLARELSLAGDFVEALAIYEGVLAESPDNNYAQHYAAYHLERLGQEPDRAEALFRGAARNQPRNDWWIRRLCEALVRRGRIGEAMDEWRRGTSRLVDDPEDHRRNKALAKNYHLGVARRLLSRGALVEAREVLESVPEDIRNSDPELSSLSNDLEHMEESERLGGAVFPRSVEFAARWAGPQVRPEIGDRPSLRAWYPGYIEAIDDNEVTLVLADRGSVEDGSTAALFRSSLGLQQFCEAARLKSTEAEPGQFVEVYILDDGTQDGRTEVAVHPRPRRGGLRLLMGTLRTVPLDDYDDAGSR